MPPSRSLAPLAWKSALVAGLLLAPLPTLSIDLLQGIESGLAIRLDWIAHGLLFGWIGWAAIRAAVGRGIEPAGGAAIAYAGLLGGVTEALQAATGWRTGEIGDWVADLVGAALAVAFDRLRRRRPEPIASA